jgi:hypothetical protein
MEIAPDDSKAMIDAANKLCGRRNNVEHIKFAHIIVKHYFKVVEQFKTLIWILNYNNILILTIIFTIFQGLPIRAFSM